MKQINQTRLGYQEGKIYVQGNFLPWYNGGLDCLEDKLRSKCPLNFVNCSLMTIDQEGLWLQLPNSYEKNDTWFVEVDGYKLDKAWFVTQNSNKIKINPDQLLIWDWSGRNDIRNICCVMEEDEEVGNMVNYCRAWKFDKKELEYNGYELDDSVSII